MLETFDSTVLQAGLVDIDGTLLFQLGLFIVFAAALNVLVVRPMAKAHQQRFERMEGAREEAEKMNLRAAEAVEEYEDKLDVERQKAVSRRDEIKAEADDERRKKLAEASAKANEEKQKAADKREAMVKKADDEVEPKAGELADLIVDQLLGKAGK